ncbi:hypothetical protein BKA64DRAFT_696711 [Cadophora sp. MPI-SDFR-AT-0126]|nr:hypothetical protein BKA64DRAFT_696711 [Leotiomycetes sp. MPI-SDFR-AT-0126]
MASTFKGTVEITHICTATAILSINGINMLTDPFFSSAGTTRRATPAVVLENTESPAMALHNLPVIDAILPSHENHFDNLDDLGRQLLDGRRESIDTVIAGKPFQITATPCVHFPGHERPETDDLPNAIYFSGDTIHLPELAEMRRKFHITIALFNIGAAFITMGRKQAAHLFRDIGADILGKEGLRSEFEAAGIIDQVRWLEPGVTQRIV